MPAGGARRGRRDNGLSAAEYAAVGDVDPRVGEHLLDVLAGAGIAAYLQPATDLHPVTRTTTLPARPTDRLFADRDHLDTAKDLLARLRADERGPEAAASGSRAAAPEPFDVEAAWAGIVAGFNERVDSTTAHWPAAEDVADDDGTDEEPADRQRVIRYAAEEGAQHGMSTAEIKRLHSGANNGVLQSHRKFPHLRRDDKRALERAANANSRRAAPAPAATA